MQKEQMTPGSDGTIPLISATVLEDGDAMGCGLPSAFTKVNSSLLPPVTLPLASCLHRRRFVPRAYPLPLGGSGEGRGRSGPAPPSVRTSVHHLHANCVVSKHKYAENKVRT